MVDKLSVIVPVYNREDQIAHCIQTLVNQTYPNIEIIVINDGSTDATGQILAGLKADYPNQLVIIESKNVGVSEARNKGIEVAQGKFIGFVDSDDYVTNDMYEKLYNKMVSDNFDMVACNSITIYPKHQIEVDSGIQDYQKNEQLLIDAYAVLWNKLYKAEIIKKYRFKRDYWYEDVLFLNQLYPDLKIIGSIPDICYYYVQTENSITYTYNEKLYELIDNMDDLILDYQSRGIFEKYQAELEYTYVRYLFGTFIKRLAKSKDIKQFYRGVKFVIDKVKSNFPNYKSNTYINEKNGKSLYLKYFNIFFSIVIYLKEKNNMN